MSTNDDSFSGARSRPLVAPDGEPLKRSSTTKPNSLAMAYSVPTDGMTRLRSICDTRLGDTPTYRARPRTVIPFCSRATRSREPRPAEAVSRLSPGVCDSRSAFRGFGAMLGHYTEALSRTPSLNWRPFSVNTSSCGASRRAMDERDANLKKADDQNRWC